MLSSFKEQTVPLAPGGQLSGTRGRLRRVPKGLGPRGTWASSGVSLLPIFPGRNTSRVKCVLLPARGAEGWAGKWRGRSPADAVPGGPWVRVALARPAI